ncbi:MAG: hypothetical protein N7Q72_01480 [Spiroplasma sp. Tabriz.8]|nr:hypothetical protein [Spiroplasma sp. Tabriz.8]
MYRCIYIYIYIYMYICIYVYIRKLKKEEVVKNYEFTVYLHNRE